MYIRLKDASGRVVVDDNTLVLKEVAMVDIASPSGTVDVGQTVNDIVPVAVNNDTSRSLAPRFSVSGSSLSWFRQNNDNGQLNAKMMVMLL